MSGSAAGVFAWWSTREDDRLGWPAERYYSRRLPYLRGSSHSKRLGRLRLARNYTQLSGSTTFSSHHSFRLFGPQALRSALCYLGESCNRGNMKAYLDILEKAIQYRRRKAIPTYSEDFQIHTKTEEASAEPVDMSLSARYLQASASTRLKSPYNRRTRDGRICYLTSGKATWALSESILRAIQWR